MVYLVTVPHGISITMYSSNYNVFGWFPDIFSFVSIGLCTRRSFFNVCKSMTLIAFCLRNWHEKCIAKQSSVEPYEWSIKFKVNIKINKNKPLLKLHDILLLFVVILKKRAFSSFSTFFVFQRNAFLHIFAPNVIEFLLADKTNNSWAKQIIHEQKRQ